MNTLMVRRYGWKRPLPCHNKPMISQVMPHLLKVGALPRKFSLRNLLFNPYDQLTLGSCTGNALARALAFCLLMESKLTKIQCNTPAGTPSRLMIYYDEREREGTVSSDAGAAIHDGVRSLHKQGTCFENVWRYDVNQFAVKPPPQAYRLAQKDLVHAYAAIDIADVMSKKMAIFNKVLVAQGFTCFSELESDMASKTGQVPLPGPGDQTIGGHAIVLTGWDDDMVIDGQQGAFEWGNSWGIWGDAGYGWSPYSYFNNPNLADDAWVLQTAG